MRSECPDSSDECTLSSVSASFFFLFVLKLCGGGGGSEGIVFGNKSNFLWIVVEQSDFFFLPPPRKMKMKGVESGQNKKYQEEGRELEVASIKKKSRSFSLLFYASTWQSRSRVRASSALSRRVIPILSMVRVRYVAALLVGFFIISFATRFSSNEDQKTKRKRNEK